MIRVFLTEHETKWMPACERKQQMNAIRLALSAYPIRKPVVGRVGSIAILRTQGPGQRPDQSSITAWHFGFPANVWPDIWEPQLVSSHAVSVQLMAVIVYPNLG
jgi:hypothetical protein